ncbi:unnamed protein product [Prorocentrum cordatum]|uniref:Vms1-associating treble clef domain-containing protein n=1 Tax=Prorocentrum cordatum TaxID=2364126 RepID=A0ABN9T4S2_9DINO|nr:unnamed protein product [Polarella glacialis]
MAEGRGGRGGGRSGRGAGRGGDGASAAGLPIFCRARYFVRGAGVYSVPLWDLTSRWMPDELKQYAREAPARGRQAVPTARLPPRRRHAAAAARPPPPRPGPPRTAGRLTTDRRRTRRSPAAAADGGEGSASDSEQSEIAWEGLLGSESRVWSRAGVQGALVLMRQALHAWSGRRSSRAEPEALEAAVADGPSAESYGLGVCSCLFAPEAIVDGADAPLDRRLVEGRAGGRALPGLGPAQERITEELEGGADPAARDSKGRVPYFLCPTQKARDAFRRWRGENEDEWDWSAAQVPEALTDEVEQRKKDKDKEKKKKLKEKQKLAKAKAREEDEERARREEEEARALAAAQAKCESCAKPIVSKPFARLDYLYCSAECVSAHRRELQAQAAMKRFGGGS